MLHSNTAAAFRPETVDDTEIARTINEQCLARRTLALARAVRRPYDHALRRVGLNLVQLAALAQIAEHDQLRAWQIREATAVDKAWLSRNLDSLVRRGLILMDPLNIDERGSTYCMTPEGTALLREAYREWLDATGASAELLGPDARAFADIIERFEHRTERNRP